MLTPSLYAKIELDKWLQYYEVLLPEQITQLFDMFVLTVWEHFKKSYLWDMSHPFPIHHKLSQDHIFLNNESKMRNHLAEDILDKEMLHLMEV